MAGPDIKWTAGPGPAPLPYSKRAREAMGVTDDDKPWAHPDPPAAESWGFGGGGGGDALREGSLRTNLFLIVLSIIFAIWVYRKVVKRDHSPFFHVSPTPSQSEDVKVSEVDMRTAREARLKRFQETKTSYADMMKEAAGGWSPAEEVQNDYDGGNSVAAEGQGCSDGLRRRGGGDQATTG
ncbi:unnamed protein product [Ectocarpus sp. CCAP 1310/34]|nr:unnamed protein product [Ectocarpus sp. CCAP 1310/34]